MRKNISNQRLSTQLTESERRVRVLYVSTYIPRECGIATFTKDLTNAINLLNPTCLADITAIDDKELNKTSYQYPWEVKHRIQQDSLTSWLDMAKHINDTSADVVSIQHEFGIYGPPGTDGENIIPFMEKITKPIVVTFHTVLPEPTEHQLEVVQKIAERAEAIVVMVNVAVKWLTEVYNLDEHKIVVIPHGVPDIPFTPSIGPKAELGLKNYKTIMGFGLVNRGKGYEQAISALPLILERHPKTKLLILGETHPVVRRQEGEKYRNKLKRLAKRLGVQDYIVWVNRYLSLDEIIEYLKATDIYITPFINLQQITSGTLSYAVGAGRVCLSSPYLYAGEVLDENRGFIVEPFCPIKFAKAVNQIFDHPRKSLEVAKRAYDYGRNMIWPSVALRYLDLFEILIKRGEHANS
ncbi:MAG TPA: glycosyltransferase family 4 protein [Candidatus Saccharimonadales bacterium]|nr:glycosyltransferase family 4 protein [Candidatus Saccharimonadales bacterium]